MTRQDPTVLIIAFPGEPVSEDSIGGAEQVIHSLETYLCQSGWDCSVLAKEGSRVRSRLIPLNGYSVADVLNETLSHRHFDLIHYHGTNFSECQKLPCSAPVLVTLHLPLSHYSEQSFRNSDTLYFHCVSPTQDQAFRTFATTHGFDLRILNPVENGLPLKLFQRELERLPPALPIQQQPYVLMLGRICPEKGFHLGIEAAQLAGLPSFIGGKVFPYKEHLQYFDELLKPSFSRNCTFLEGLSFKDKINWLARAQCLLVPSLAEETSSLVCREALACGTPVVAFDRGALREVVLPGRTGYLVENVSEMAQAIKETKHLDRSFCRRFAEEHFGIEKTLLGYSELYRNILASCPFVQRQASRKVRAHLSQFV